MTLDDVDDPFELIGGEWVERMGVLGELSSARAGLCAEACQLLTSVLLSVLL
jgi:hypothetical protein